MRGVWRILCLLAAIWLLVAGSLLALRLTSSSPEKLKAYIDGHPLGGLPPPQREKVVAKTASLLNRLSGDQRQSLHGSELIPAFVRQLTPGERIFFLEKTLPADLRQFLAELKNMHPMQRRRLSRRLLARLRDNKSLAAQLIGEDDLKKLGEQGIAVYYREADPRVQEDLAPSKSWNPPSKV